MLNPVIRRGAFIVLGFCILLLPLANSASAESLWSDSGPSANLYADHKAHGVGDIITILINETSSASRAGTASNSKSTNTTTNAGVGIFHGIANASAANADSFKAQGTITNTNVVSARMTAVVLEVKPNGNLLISGTQTIKQNGEEQKIIVSGTVRQDDIATDNTVLSSNIADAQVQINGRGPIANKQRQGIISQIFNFLF